MRLTTCFIFHFLQLKFVAFHLHILNHLSILSTQMIDMACSQHHAVQILAGFVLHTIILLKLLLIIFLDSWSLDLLWLPHYGMWWIAG